MFKFLVTTLLLTIDKFGQQRSALCLLRHSINDEFIGIEPNTSKYGNAKESGYSEEMNQYLVMTVQNGYVKNVNESESQDNIHEYAPEEKTKSSPLLLLLEKSNAPDSVPKAVTVSKWDNGKQALRPLTADEAKNMHIEHLQKLGTPMLVEEAKSVASNAHADDAPGLVKTLLEKFPPSSKLRTETPLPLKLSGGISIRGFVAEEEKSFFLNVTIATSEVLYLLRLARASKAETADFENAGEWMETIKFHEKKLLADILPREDKSSDSDVETGIYQDGAETGNYVDSSNKRFILEFLDKNTMTPIWAGNIVYPEPVLCATKSGAILTSAVLYKHAFCPISEMRLHQPAAQWAAAVSLLEVVNRLHISNLWHRSLSPLSCWVNEQGRIVLGFSEHIMSKDYAFRCNFMNNMYAPYVPPEWAEHCQTNKENTGAAVKAKPEEKGSHLGQVDVKSVNEGAEIIDPTISNLWSAGLILYHIFCTVRIPFHIEMVAHRSDQLNQLQRLASSKKAELDVSTCGPDPRVKRMITALLKPNPKHRIPVHVLMDELIKEDSGGMETKD